MQKKTRSILEELTSANLTQDKENLVLSRASHIIDSSINFTNLMIEISLPHDTFKVSLEGDSITNSITLDNNDIGT